MDVIDRIKNIFVKDEIGEPPWEYDFLYNLPESEYPKYLKKIFKYKTGEDLPLKRENGELVVDKKRCKTFNQKIQWLKLYDATQLKRDCTDKVKVRNYVKEKIGSEYLKPILQVCDNFDEIDFDKLPDSFVIKCNHGCKWQYIIKNKEEFINTKPLFELVKRKINGWLEQEFWCWEGFEMQYKDIEPKIIIEPLLREDLTTQSREIEVYCFNGRPKLFINVKYGNKRELCCYDENFHFIDLVLHPDGNNIIIKEEADDILNQTIDLSSKLSKEFKFVRCDWFVYENKLFFNELTFTPYSGFIEFDKKWNLKIGKF